MKIESKQLIKDLVAKSEISTATVLRLKNLSPEQLNFKKTADSWSALECIEHLNLYGDYYLPEIEKQILKQKNNSSTTYFKSGVLGNYFANLMSVENGKIKKMKSPKDKNPANSNLSVTVIDRFLKQQERLKALLLQSAGVDLTKTKTAISISKLIKLRLGDTFRFFVYHIERHVLQAEKTQQN